MSKQKDGMTPERWAQIKAMPPQHGRWLHISKRAGMVDNPIDPLLPKIPYVDPVGRTYRVGRNEEKRMKKHLAALR